MLARLVSFGVAAVALGVLSSPTPAQAQLLGKVAVDLQLVIAAPTTTAPQLKWTQTNSGVTYVKALIIANSDATSGDPTLAALRAAVLANGGSVYFRYLSIGALSVMLPASQVSVIAARPDVQSISPNRPTMRTASTLEYTTGALAAGVRTTAGRSYYGLDGAGVGLAVLDSGIAWNHDDMLGPNGLLGASSRVAHAVNFVMADAAKQVGVNEWAPGIDGSTVLVPGSAVLQNYEQAVNNTGADRPDRYGHGTHVASVAAGRGSYQSTDSTGIAPNATLFDVRVLGADGTGQLSDVLEGIEWVIYHAKEYNIRVMNLSLAADSTESYQTDPLCRAVRSAVAAGITVVVAAGNFGKDANGNEVFGTISSPGDEPSAITVGSVNTHGTITRRDDTVNHFSSRGPTRGLYVAATGTPQNDNLLKPDLVAPGNKIVGAVASDISGSPSLWAYLPATYPQLSAPYGGTKQLDNEALFNLSGTSIAAPVVAGATALMLQANPGLTPPLIKAILQYTAQPLPGYDLVEQGAGELNIEGAVRLAKALRTDIGPAISAGRINPGDHLLAAGSAMPAPTTTINGESFNWSRIVFGGGSYLLSGSALFTAYQPIYDPSLVWVRHGAQRTTVTDWPWSLFAPANTYPQLITSGLVKANQVLVTPGVIWATDLAGTSSYAGQTGFFIPTATISSDLISGSGIALSQGVALGEGVALCEGVAIGEGVALAEGVALGEGIALGEGVALGEGIALGESGTPFVSPADDSSLLGEP